MAPTAIDPIATSIARCKKKSGDYFYAHLSQRARDRGRRRAAGPARGAQFQPCGGARPGESIPIFCAPALSAAEKHGVEPRADSPRSEERRVGKECRSRW